MKIWIKAVAAIEAAIENQENIMVLVITMSMEQPQQYHWYLLTQILLSCSHLYSGSL
jgi:hypothetical protein